MASRAETRQKLKLQQNQGELKKLKERLAKAKSILKQNMDQGKKLAAGRVKAIAQMEKDILKLQGKPAAEAQAKFNSVKETLIKQNRKLDKTPRTRIRKNQSNEDKDSSIVQSAVAKSAPKKPAGLTPSQMKTKMEKRRQDIKESKLDKGSGASQRRFEAKTELARQKELDAVGPGPNMKKRSMPGESGVAFPKATKPKTQPKTVDTKSKSKTVTAKSKPRSERTLAERPTTSASTRKTMEKRNAADRRAEKDKGPRNVRTETRQPGRFSEEAAKKFFKEKFGIDVTYDKDDDLDPLVARGEEPGRKKGGLFTRRGALYNKPARKK